MEGMSTKIPASMEEHNLKGTSFASDIVYCQVEGVRLLKDHIR